MRHCVAKDMPAMPNTPTKIVKSRVSELRFKRVKMVGAKNSGKNVPKVRSSLCMCTYAIPLEAKKLNVLPVSMDEFNADFTPIKYEAEEAMNEHWVWNAPAPVDPSSVDALDEKQVLQKVALLNEGLPPFSDLIPSDAESLFSLANIKMFATCCLKVIS